MDDLTMAVCVIAALFLLVVDALLASYFYDVACEKGFAERRYFWVPFLCGIIGYLLVVALPDRMKTNGTVPKAKPAKITFEQTGAGRWTCPECGSSIPFDVIRCKCGYER